MPIRLPPEPVPHTARSVVIHEGPAILKPATTPVPPAADKARAMGSRRKAVEVAASPEQLQAATEALRNSVYASTSKQSIKLRLDTWDEIARNAGFQDTACMTPEMVMSVVAALKSAGYRSVPAYLSAAHVRHTEQGHATDDLLALTCKQAKRAAARHQGPPRQATALPLHRLGDLPAAQRPWTDGGPVHPRDTLLLGCHWLLRAGELTSLRLNNVGVHSNINGVSEATVHIPRSKTDQTASGCTRSLSCAACPPPHDAARCPACALRRLRGSRVEQGATDKDLLVVDNNYQAVTRPALSATVAKAAEILELQSTGTQYTAHSMRVSGATHYAHQGEDRLRQWGRWQSSAYSLYVRPGASQVPSALQAGSSSSPPLPALVRAQGPKAKVHWVQAPPPHSTTDSAVWRTECGWKFGRTPGSWVEAEDVPGKRCPKCWAKGHPAGSPLFSRPPSPSSDSNSTSSSFSAQQ